MINKVLDEEEANNYDLKKIKEDIRKSCETLYKKGLSGKQYYNKPLFSIHVPGDYNSMSYMIDEYQDFKKMSLFCMKRLK